MENDFIENEITEEEYYASLDEIDVTFEGSYDTLYGNEDNDYYGLIPQLDDLQAQLNIINDKKAAEAAAKA